jgi:cystathionine gamma-synthase
LAQHPAIEAVLYPGLADHPGHAIAQSQMVGGYGGLLSVLVKGGRSAALRVAAQTRLFTQATSFGGPHSTLEHRASVEAPDSGTPGNLLRLSIGLEHPEDLIADLEASLQLVL